MSLAQKVSGIKDGLLDLIFPPYCVGCGREGVLICPACEAALPRIEPPWCSKCGLPRSGPCVCGTSRGRIWALDGLRVPFVFEETIREAIYGLKYKNLRSIAAPLARHLADLLLDEPFSFDLLVPVPLHSRRLRERGYNQAEIIARHLGRLVQVPVATDRLRRHRYTAPQARTADVEERRSNVSRAFGCRPGSVTGLKVLLVDDVTTTGATLEACAIELRKAGAVEVWGLAVAREL